MSQTKSKHTPGPWYIDEDDAFTVRTDGKDKLMWIVDLYPDADKENESGMREREANARLIAAAPNMLEALQKARNSIDSFGSADPNAPTLIDVLDKAIAKATGGAQ